MIGDGFGAVLCRAQHGDLAAFSLLWRDGNSGLLRYLSAIAPEVADDVAADTWMQVVRHLPPFRGDEAAWREWLFTTARRCADENWPRSRPLAGPLREVPEGQLPLSSGAADLAMEHFGARSAIALLEGLPRLQAEVILLRVVAGLDTDAVARVVCRNPGSVRVAAHRGLHRLVQILENADTGRDISDGAMPYFPRPDQPEASWMKDDASVTALLAGTELPVGAAVNLEPVAEILAALRAQPGGDEPVGEAAAIAAFGHRFGAVTPAPRRSRRRRPAARTSPRGAKAAAAAAIAFVSVGAAAASAAFAGVLPDPLQQFAHQAIGAPAARYSEPAAAHYSKPDAAHSAGRAAVTVPDARGHAAFGLCTAYQHAAMHGTAAHKAAALRKLAEAAGGTHKVAAFCAAVRQHGNKASGHPDRPAHRGRHGAAHPHHTRHPTVPPGHHARQRTGHLPRTRGPEQVNMHHSHRYYQSITRHT